ncbi:hypothetical protein BC828DRAFT_389007 [Blastocladiella britannica]|nr:hypothetical protein BC828DRAFT_389007 [Blastocladiella britannica]
MDPSVSNPLNRHCPASTPDPDVTISRITWGLLPPPPRNVCNIGSLRAGSPSSCWSAAIACWKSCMGSIWPRSILRVMMRATSSINRGPSRIMSKSPPRIPRSPASSSASWSIMLGPDSELDSELDLELNSELDSEPDSDTDSSIRPIVFCGMGYQRHGTSQGTCGPCRWLRAA